MARPIVLVTAAPGTGQAGPRTVLNSAYTRALDQAGLAPVLIAPDLGEPTVRALLDRADGVVLSGGADLHPARYGESPDGTDMETVSIQRDSQELSLAQLALEANLPLLAICRGMQVLNVALGGSLLQDIASRVAGSLAHRQLAPRTEPGHAVQVNGLSRLGTIAGRKRLVVNSLHHQAVGRAGAGVLVTAHAKDGVVEAIELPTARWVIGVQWHPEEMIETADHARRLFAAFHEACAG